MEQDTNQATHSPITPPPPVQSSQPDGLTYVGLSHPQASKRLERTVDGPIGGVAGGIGNYLGVDGSIVRIIWLAMMFFYGTGLLLYLAAWLIIPKAPSLRVPPPPPLPPLAASM